MIFIHADINSLAALLGFYRNNSPSLDWRIKWKISMMGRGYRLVIFYDVLNYGNSIWIKGLQSILFELTGVERLKRSNIQQSLHFLLSFENLPLRTVDCTIQCRCGLWIVRPSLQNIMTVSANRRTTTNHMEGQLLWGKKVY